MCLVVFLYILQYGKGEELELVLNILTPTE